MLKVALMSLFIYIIFRLMIFVEGINWDLRKNNLSFGIYRQYVVLTTAIHELSHYITAKLFGFKVDKFKVANNKELKEDLDLQNLGEVEFTPENKNGYVGFSEILGSTITGLAPFLLSFVVFIMFIGLENIIEANNPHIVFNYIKLFFYTPIALFDMLGFPKFLLLIVLFVGIITSTSTLSKADIDVAIHKENLIANIYLGVYFLIVIVLNKIISITSIDLMNQIPISKVLIVFFSLFFIGLLLGLLRLYVLRTILLLLTTIPLATIFTGLFNIFMIFMCFYLIMLLLNIVVSLLLVKFIGSPDVDINTENQNDFGEEEEW